MAAHSKKVTVIPQVTVKPTTNPLAGEFYVKKSKHFK